MPGAYAENAWRDEHFTLYITNVRDLQDWIDNGGPWYLDSDLEEAVYQMQEFDHSPTELWDNEQITVDDWEDVMDSLESVAGQDPAYIQNLLAEFEATSHQYASPWDFVRDAYGLTLKEAISQYVDAAIHAFINETPPETILANAQAAGQSIDQALQDAWHNWINGRGLEGPYRGLETLAQWVHPTWWEDAIRWQYEAASTHNLYEP